MCVCCVVIPFILDVRLFGRTSRGHTGGRSHRISHPPSFCGVCLNFSREKDSLIPFPHRPRSRLLCTNELIVLHTWAFFYFHFFVRKNPSSMPCGNSSFHMCLCVCVCFLPIHSGHQVGRTSRGHTGGRSHRIFNPLSFCGACLDFCREKDSAIPFPRRP